MIPSGQILLAQQNDADHGDEQKDGDNLEREQVLGEEQPAQRRGGSFRLRRGGGAQAGPQNGPDAEGGQGAGRAEAGHDAGGFDLPSNLLLQVEQHDDEEEQNHDRDGIDQDLNGGEEKGVEQDEEPGEEHDGEHEEHGAGDRVAAERIGDHEEAAEQGERGEEIEEKVAHGWGGSGVTGNV